MARDYEPGVPRESLREPIELRMGGVRPAPGYGYGEGEDADFSPRKTATVAVVADPLTCPVCQRVCASRIGLISHSRTHKG